VITKHILCATYIQTALSIVAIRRDLVKTKRVAYYNADERCIPKLVCRDCVPLIWETLRTAPPCRNM